MSNAPEKLTFSSGDFEDKFTEITDETEIEYTRTDTIPSRAQVAREEK